MSIPKYHPGLVLLEFSLQLRFNSVELDSEVGRLVEMFNLDVSTDMSSFYPTTRKLHFREKLQLSTSTIPLSLSMGFQKTIIYICTYLLY